MNQAVERALIDYSNDIWAQAMRAGALEERQRILTSLEDDSDLWKSNNIKEFLIQLIKGEK
jgi:hypothetical protein